MLVRHEFNVIYNNVAAKQLPSDLLSFGTNQQNVLCESTEEAGDLCVRLVIVQNGGRDDGR